MRLNKQIETDGESGFENTAAWLTFGVDIEARRLNLIGEVSEHMEAIVLRGLIEMASLSPTEPITIYLSTYGGDAYSGLAIYEQIQSCPCPITIVANGKIMSAGTIIFLAGDVRIASQSTRFMIHSIQLNPAEGSLKTVEIDVSEAKFINNEMIRIYSERTKIKNPKYWQKKLLTPAIYFSISEAKELGFIKEAGEKKKSLTKVVKTVKVKKAPGAKKNAKRRV